MVDDVNWHQYHRKAFGKGVYHCQRSNCKGLTERVFIADLVLSVD